MKAVNIAELKNNLSLYLRKVRSGQEIIVRDRDVPVAKIIPWQGDYDEELLELARKGIVSLGNGKPLGDDFWDIPVPKVPEDVIRRIVKEEREAGW